MGPKCRRPRSYQDKEIKEMKEQEITVPLIKELPIRLTRENKPDIVPSLFVVVPQPDGAYSIYLSDPANNQVARAIISGAKFFNVYIVILQILFWPWLVWTVLRFLSSFGELNSANRPGALGGTCHFPAPSIPPPNFSCLLCHDCHIIPSRSTYLTSSWKSS